MSSNYTYGELDDVLLKVHDLSMSKDTMKACEGRAAKVMANMLMAWLDGEIERRTEPAVVIMAGISLSMSALTSTFVSVCHGDEDVGASVLRGMRDHIIERLDGCISNLDEIVAKRKETQ